VGGELEVGGVRQTAEKFDRDRIRPVVGVEALDVVIDGHGSLEW
jgi:hypothetical protein